MKALSKTEVPDGVGAWLRIMTEGNFCLMRFKRLHSVNWSVDIYLSKANNRRWVCTTDLISGKKSIFRYAASISLIAIQALFEQQYQVEEPNVNLRSYTY